MTAPTIYELVAECRHASEKRRRVADYWRERSEDDMARPYDESADWHAAITDALERLMELEREVERLREALTPLHDELAALLCDEDLTDEKLRRAADTLLPRLHDALIPLVRAARTQEDTDGDA